MESSHDQVNSDQNVEAHADHSLAGILDVHVGETDGISDQVSDEQIG